MLMLLRLPQRVAAVKGHEWRCTSYNSFEGHCRNSWKVLEEQS